MEPEVRSCVQYWYLFACSDLSYLVWLSLGILPYTCLARLMPNLDSGCHVCFCKFEFVQTHGSCIHLCQGELQLSVKPSTYFSMLLVEYMLQLVSTYLEYTILAKTSVKIS